MLPFSESQTERLAVLGMRREHFTERVFKAPGDRDRAFQKLEKEAAAKNKNELADLLFKTREPRIAQMTRAIKEQLFQAGFSEMLTPAVIPRLYLERMSIDAEHPLSSQVFWLDQKSCLRPMLAPGLYAVSQKLLNISPLPLRIFEIGSCFRKESEGRIHLKEFTMLNLVEWGTPEDSRDERIHSLAAMVMDAAGITDFRLEQETSAVYGSGADVVDASGMELASSSMGPHRLDWAWKISCSWVGIGFGLERLLASRERSEGVHRFGRSFSFADGAALDIK